MKTVAALIAATVLLAGCSSSGSDESPAPRPTKTSADASRELDRSAMAKQAEEQAAQMEAAKKDLAEAVGSEAADVKIVMKDGKVSPQGGRFEARVGEEITLSVTSDAADEIHVHSDPEHTFDIAAGKTQLFTFTVDTPGQVAVEAHGAGVTIVQLVVRP